MSNTTNESRPRKSLRVAFKSSLKSYVAGLDQLYTYQTEDDLEVGEAIKVETPKGLKRAVVISIDEVFNAKAAKRFNGLANAYKDKP